MTKAEQREAARQFYNKWHGKGKEDEHARSYWIELLHDVLGMERVTDRLDFEKKVVGADGNTKRIDVYIPETRVIIEQKSLGIALDKPQAGHDSMTPYEQAKYYDNYLPFDEKARWIVTSNFAEIWIYDMNAKIPAPVVVDIQDLQNEAYRLEFLVQKESTNVSKELEVSIQAGELVGKLYDAFVKQYGGDMTEHDFKSLNMLCVRIVFCLYAEDAGLFGKHAMFHDYLESYPVDRMNTALRELFAVLNQPIEKRYKFLQADLAAYPYVNGGLFEKEVDIPPFTDEIRSLVLRDASEEFDWSQISPTIFGAVFESTLNPETRRSGGMHYTSIENIHKVIDPLFLDDLKAEFEEIKQLKVARTKKTRLEEFRRKLASLTFLDPACGSGNFLTETYISLRRLENDAILEAESGQMQLGYGASTNPVLVSIQQFYGIEINDFAVEVAKAALWIAEDQMLQETEQIIHQHIEFLPLKTYANIVNGNALRLDWENVVPKSNLSYIMGNPPFVGGKLQNERQKAALIDLFGKDVKRINSVDYVAGWYYKAVAYIQESDVKCAFVSTNSIVQGMQVAPIWETLKKRFQYSINFAHEAFVWNSEASEQAKVHVIIIGFAFSPDKQKRLFSNGAVSIVPRINSYLYDADEVFIEARKTPVSDNVPPCSYGSLPNDGGYYLFSENEMEEFISREPKSKPLFHEFLGSRELINNTKRYCLYLKGVAPSVLRQMPLVMERVEKVKELRLQSSAEATRKAASRPTTFFSDTVSTTDYIAIPEVSSERRRYIPIAILNSDVFVSNKVWQVQSDSLYHFGVLTSNVHNAFMRVVSGRMKSDYSYSAAVVYNNFPWCTPSDEQKAVIEKTAQAILDARALYPDNSLADLYDPLTMPPELVKAHRANDIAVMKAYGFDVKSMSEADCVAALMKMYQELTDSE